VENNFKGESAMINRILTSMIMFLATDPETGEALVENDGC
jgi:hypothetical protein